MPFVKGQPKPGPGRPKGVSNKITREIRETARDLLESVEYQANLRERLINGELAPQIEVMLHHYAYGVPRQPVDVSGELALFGVLAVPAGVPAEEWAARAREQQKPK